MAKKTAREIRAILMKTRKELSEQKDTMLYKCISVASAYLGATNEINDSTLLDFLRGNKVIPFTYYPTIHKIIFDPKFF